MIVYDILKLVWNCIFKTYMRCVLIYVWDVLILFVWGFVQDMFEMLILVFCVFPFVCFMSFRNCEMFIVIWDVLRCVWIVIWDGLTVWGYCLKYGRDYVEMFYSRYALLLNKNKTIIITCLSTCAEMCLQCFEIYFRLSWCV